MPEPARKADLSLYDRDYAAWSADQALALAARRLDRLDWSNLAEEIESLGKSQRQQVRNRLRILLQHLLKWHYQPNGRKGGWEASIIEARTRIDGLIDDSPSLHGYPEEVLAAQYRVARRTASAQTGISLENFPETCPYEIADILTDGFYPGAEA